MHLAKQLCVGWKFDAVCETLFKLRHQTLNETGRRGGGTISKHTPQATLVKVGSEPCTSRGNVNDRTTLGSNVPSTRKMGQPLERGLAGERALPALRGDDRFVTPV